MTEPSDENQVGVDINDDMNDHMDGINNNNGISSHEEPDEEPQFNEDEYVNNDNMNSNIDQYYSNKDIDDAREYQDDREYYDNRDRMAEAEDNYDDENVIIPGVDDLPLFANPEARKIDLKIKAHEEKIEITVDKITELAERVKIMKEHFKNVQQEVEHTNALYNAKHAEMLTEKHLKQLTSRALGRSQVETKQIQQEIDRLQDQLSICQQDIFNANEKMNEFKMQMNWNQDELEQWATAAKQKEDDALALQKYTRADELKIKSLNMDLEHLTKECLIKRMNVENESTETQAKQAELDRIAVDFKKLHIERQSLVKRWQETIDEMKQRDMDINGLGERFATAKSERIHKAGIVATQHKRLDAQKLENKDVESRSEALGRIVSNKRDEMMQGNAKLQALRQELESLKNELTVAAETLVTKRTDNTNKSKSMEERRVQLERERQQYSAVKLKLEAAKSGATSAEDTAKQAEDDLDRTEKDFNSMIVTMKELKDTLFKENQTLFELKREEARIRGEIVGSKSTTRNMETQLNTLDKEAARQQELLYNAEFQIQQIERKVARGMGERSDDEKRALRKAITEAESRRDAAKEKRKTLQQQLRKLQNELVNEKNRRDELIAQKKSLLEKQHELELENRMLEDDIKKDIRSKEEMLIGNDLLRLEVRRLRDLLSAKADVVYSLENRKQQLLLSMEERKQEISVHKDILKAQLKTLNEDKHRLIMDLRDREAVVEKLKARFETVPRGQDEGHSQAYYVIKAAQKKEELQRRGDELDQDVRRCEREIRALQTTLDHLNARNIAYRTSFMKIDINGEDASTLRQLEERAKASKDAVFRKKKDLSRLSTDVEEDERRLEQLKIQNNRITKQRESLESARQQVEEEILTQEVQLEDFNQRIEKLIFKQRSKAAEINDVDMSNFNNGTLEEKAAKAEVLKDVIQNILYTLGQLSNEFPEVRDDLSSRLKEADLRMPLNAPVNMQ